MDLGTWIIFGVVALLAINHFLLRLPGWTSRRGVFWGVQVVNLAAACFMIVVGIPNLHGLAHYLNWVIALLFMFHIIQNNGRLVAARRAEAREEDEQDAAARERIHAALHKKDSET
ncbi:MAG: hypothetical protein GXP62_02125 [Oligoflexia bacterium]|nr:hypothetical protein [Oligoflexia bacterium]